MKKSYIAQVLWTVIGGPLGLFYSSATAGAVMLIIAVLLAMASGGLLLIFLWPVTIFVGLGTVQSYNEKVDLEERRHQELLEATRRGGPSGQATA
jgi:hypothetical protein